jgi:hypothetical protein
LPLPLPSNFPYNAPSLSKFSPPFQQSLPSQPPPLPPLPPELASKYALNKIALNLDTIESKPANNNFETSSLESTDGGVMSPISSNIYLKYMFLTSEKLK